jgi:hypothetical protein
MLSRKRNPNFHVDLCPLHDQDGARGVRGSLKGIARQLRTELAEAMGIVVASAEPSQIEPNQLTQKKIS